MDNCTMSITLAHGMLIYILASVFYLLRTRTIGTPFNDSLTEEQKKIKRESANVRRTIFYSGVAIGVVSMFIFRPFSRC